MEPDVWKLPDAFKAYEDGKQRRDKLLFAVNGAAFAIVKLIHGKEQLDLGHMSQSKLSVGMIAFTHVIVVDIWAFGRHPKDRRGR
jgi:hypothetical protein